MGRTKNPKKDLARQVEKRDRSKRDQVSYQDGDFVPFPSTLLNLACSDNHEWGPQVGKIVNIIGDSSSGKTFLCLSILAEMCADPIFNNYRLIVDDVENANEFDMEDLFGEIAATRIEPPSWLEINEDDLSSGMQYVQEGKKTWIADPSETIEEFWINIMDALDEGTPFIYVLDSLDALDARDDQKKFDEMRAAYKKGKKAKGSYGTAKPKSMSSLLRGIKKKLKGSGSILIVISQTRDKIDAVSFGSKKTRSGGKALKFYSTHEIWLAMIETLRSKGIIIGNDVRARVSKNKVTGKQREVTFRIYYDYGIDDIRSMIDYLVENGHWKKKKNTIIAHELRIEAGMDKLIREIEDRGLEKKLRHITNKLWHDIEESVRLHRKKKYR